MSRADVHFAEPKMLIRGDLVDSKANETFNTSDPMTSDHLASILRAKATDVKPAVDAAPVTQDTWAD